MNRADLRWALDAVLPHAGSNIETDVVGIEFTDGQLAVWSTDNYTFGIAYIRDCEWPVNARLTKREAQELLRWIRPTIKATEEQEVELLTTAEVVCELHREDPDEPVEECECRLPELHVGIPDDSAVFDLRDSEVEHAALVELWDRLYDCESDPEPVYQPKIFGRFAHAERYKGDRLHIRAVKPNDKNGAAVLHIEDGTYLGAIAGLTYEAPLREQVAA